MDGMMGHFNTLFAIIAIEFTVAIVIIFYTLGVRWYAKKQQKDHAANEIALQATIQTVLAQPEVIDNSNLPKRLQELPILLATIEKLDRQYEEQSNDWFQIRTAIINKYLLSQIHENIFHAHWEKRILGLRSVICSGQLALALNSIEAWLPTLFNDEHSVVRFYAVRASVLLMSKRTLQSALDFVTTHRELSQALYYSIFEKIDLKIATYLREIHKEVENIKIKKACEYILYINHLEN
jgi:hypothetical protein